MKQNVEVAVGDLVESWARGFGRVTETFVNTVYVKFPYREKELICTLKDFEEGRLKVHKE